MEMPNRHAGPKFFARAGKSTWIGVYKYPNGKLLGPFVDRATRYVGDITCDVWNSAYTDVLLNGSGPAYIDCSQTKPDDLAFMREGMISEGLTTLVDYMDRTGLDVSKHAVEFMQYEPHIIGRGLEIDIDGQTSIPGLYAAGDMVGNFRADIAGAAVYGWIAGRHAGSTAAASELKDAESLLGLRNALRSTAALWSARAAPHGRKPTLPFSRSWTPTPPQARTVCAPKRFLPPV